MSHVISNRHKVTAVGQNVEESLIFWIKIIEIVCQNAEESSIFRFRSA